MVPSPSGGEFGWKLLRGFGLRGDERRGRLIVPHLSS